MTPLGWLGWYYQVIHRKAVERIYGPKTEDVLQALKRDPYANIPVVLDRLKQKVGQHVAGAAGVAACLPPPPPAASSDTGLRVCMACRCGAR